ncbi:MBL fold metallo-hydrolase [Psychromarinibacter sp. C21-152]|uniref:MBL fold metallo-hydrolase n=1 Tax=Psychromarinibacter sediminicola TaxID=3033385 RepID=A0AAE3NU24_9RHOB|nr:MBL fold metallo-hydrolase [Psychromarinibacter sediminicola]MDF0600572.1 MBL fold metallo-hydrolase [Psychromarinibacter sediminicola]
MHSRRTFLTRGAACAGAITVLPYHALAAAHASNTFPTDGGEIVVHPVEHASVVFETPAGTIYADPVGDPGRYADFPEPDLILVTHEHGDHYNADTLSALAGEDTPILTNPAVYDMLPEALKARASRIANGESTELAGVPIEAIPAYNLTEGRLNFHPEGRDNGYILSIDGMRVYISGDTEGTPEMRALEDIDIAFVSMNLPFTMAAEQAADAVAEFAPTYVYPYHYRGRDGGTQDPEEFARLLSEAGAETEVKLHDWYNGNLG